MATRTMTLPEAKAAYREAWEANRLEEQLNLVRARIPGLERRVDEHRSKLAELEGRLGELLKMRETFLEELEGLPKDTRHLTGQEEDRVHGRRQDLGHAIAVINGYDDPRGTIVDHLYEKLRIPGTKKRIAEEQERLAEAERKLEEARRQLDA